MKVKTILLSIIVSLVVSNAVVFAAAGLPVAHGHDGRSHSHPLPVTGKNHTHNGKKKDLSEDAGKGWTNFSTADTYYTDFKDGSYEEKKNKAGDEIGVIILKTRWRNKDKIELEKVYVTKEDCLKGYGTVVVLDLSGKFKFEFEFAENAGTVSASIARVTCQFFIQDNAKSL